MNEPGIERVRSFWEANPLWSGESGESVGSRAFFDEHRRTIIADCFAGSLDERTFPRCGRDEPVLDLGCGIGFWSLEFVRRGFRRVFAADLTGSGLGLTRRRFEVDGQPPPQLVQANAERLPFADSSFAHVNCQGVIHHTPHTVECVRQIARVLPPGGTASISVYHLNLLLRSWGVLGPTVSRLLPRGLVGLRGRGRRDLSKVGDLDELVRLFDGAENPIGKAYDRRSARALFETEFLIDEVYEHFFPARALPVPIPARLHRLLDRRLGFLIYFNLTRR